MNGTLAEIEVVAIVSAASTDLPGVDLWDVEAGSEVEERARARARGVLESEGLAALRGQVEELKRQVQTCEDRQRRVVLVQGVIGETARRLADPATAGVSSLIPREEKALREEVDPATGLLPAGWVVRGRNLIVREFVRRGVKEAGLFSAFLDRAQEDVARKAVATRTDAGPSGGADALRESRYDYAAIEGRLLESLEAASRNLDRRKNLLAIQVYTARQELEAGPGAVPSPPPIGEQLPAIEEVEDQLRRLNEPVASPRESLPEEERTALLTSAPAYHKHVRDIRLAQNITLKAAYEQAVTQIGATRWPSGFSSFKSAHTRHWRQVRERPVQ